MEKIRKRKQVFIGVNLFIGILIIIIMLFGFYNLGFVVLGMFLICFWIFGAVAYYHFRITIPYKTEIVGPILKELSPTMTYAFKEDCTKYKNLIKEYRLIPSATTFSGNDSIRDTIDDVPYLSMDFCATHTQSNGKSSQTVIDFKGKLYDITLGKTYCNFILKEDGAKKGPKGYTLIDLEAIVFNEKFDLYATDLVEIFKIFTPKRIEACRNLDFFKDRKSMICHIDDHLYIFLSNRENQFEGMPSREQIQKEYLAQLNNLNKYLEIFKE